MRRKFKKAISLAMVFSCIILNISLTDALASDDVEIQPCVYVETLPIKYEIWYSYSYGAEYRNYQYREYTFQNGYNRTDSLEGRIELTPLQYVFYEKAQLWTVRYSFY